MFHVSWQRISTDGWKRVRWPLGWELECAYKLHQHISSGIWADVRIKVTVTKGFIGATLFLKSEAEKGLKTTDLWLSGSLFHLGLCQYNKRLCECQNPYSGKEDSGAHMATHTLNTFGVQAHTLSLPISFLQVHLECRHSQVILRGAYLKLFSKCLLLGHTNLWLPSAPVCSLSFLSETGLSAWNRTNFLLLSFCVTGTQGSLAQQQRDGGRDRKRVALNLDPLPRFSSWKVMEMNVYSASIYDTQVFLANCLFITFCGIMIFSLELPLIPGVIVCKLFAFVCVWFFKICFFFCVLLTSL